MFSTTIELIDAIIEEEGIEVAPIGWDDYFPSRFESIREHYLRQGKIKEFVRFVVDMGLQARKADGEFFKALKESKEVMVRYGESCLYHLYPVASDPRMEKLFKPTENELKFLYSFDGNSFPNNFRQFSNYSLELTARILRLQSQYRVCMVPKGDFVHKLSIYPFLVELIYAVAEDIDGDEEFFNTVVYHYTSALIRHHEGGNFEAFKRLKYTVIEHLKRKNVKLVFVQGVLPTYRWKVKCLDSQLSMNDLPEFIHDMDTSKDIIMIESYFHSF